MIFHHNFSKNFLTNITRLHVAGGSLTSALAERLKPHAHGLLLPLAPTDLVGVVREDEVMYYGWMPTYALLIA